MDLPTWAPQGTRWHKLMVLDRLLDGTFYDHLKSAFYDETDAQGRPIPLERRRPSTQYRLPRYVARWAARKLFAGRHVPKVRSKDKGVGEKVKDLLTNTRIWQTMREAAYRGTVGSVAVTFRAAEGKVGLKVWRAVWCSPVFDDFGELASLRVHYTTSGGALRTAGLEVERADETYWFIRDYTPEVELTYRPIQQDDWNPAEGFRKSDMRLEVHEEVKHGLGFVPGIWIANPGEDRPDGCCLWEDAIPNSIEIDYLLSQAARGSRYNCAPQLVTQGEVKNGDEITRSPSTYLAFNAQHRDAEGEMVGGGDAKLLEMTGSGADAALKVVEQLKKMALEQIGVVHKDPADMPGPLSGRAMEYLDDDAHDVAMEWRSTYGDGGALPLICKILKVLDSEIDVRGLWLQWPRIYQPTPDDLNAMVSALKQASTPSVIAPAQGEAGKPLVQDALLSPEIASAYLEANMDLGILDDTDDGPAAGAPGNTPKPEDKPEDAIVGSEGPFWNIYKPIKFKPR